jgi:hypothetical protein
MRITTTIISICCTLTLITACKKDPDTNDLSPTAKLLVAGKWQMSAYTATVNYKGKDTTADLYATEDVCDKDDFILYAADGTGTIDESTNKCSDDQQVESFHWELQNNDTKLSVVDANPDIFDLEATSTQMKIKLTKPNTAGSPVSYSWTYKNIR